MTSQGLAPRHIIEALLWLVLVATLWVLSAQFDKPIEIYRYGAVSWPRAILLLMGIAAIGQLFYYWRVGQRESLSQLESIMQDEASTGKDRHDSPLWYLSTAVMLSLPFAYMLLPAAITGIDKPNDPALHQMKLIVAAVLVACYIVLAIRNNAGGMIALPLLFAAMLQDFGFYALAPCFIAGVMYLMGERRLVPYLWVVPLIYLVLLLLFVKLLYVGLPTGNVSPFYEFGTALLTTLRG